MSLSKVILNNTPILPSRLAYNDVPKPNVVLLTWHATAYADHESFLYAGETDLHLHGNASSGNQANSSGWQTGDHNVVISSPTEIVQVAVVRILWETRMLFVQHSQDRCQLYW
jgi:hypothetical protein